MKKLIIACTLLALTAHTYAQSRYNAILEAFHQSNSKTVLIAAHRGAHLEDPENSIASFQRAIDMGIDIIELDVRCTKDGQLVVLHDKTVNRTTNGKGDVNQLTLSQIRALRLKHNGRVTKEIVPTLEEALLFTKGKILVDLDIKTETCVDKIMEVVRKTQMEKNTLFFLYDHKFAKPVKDSGFQTLVRTHSEAEVDEVTAADAFHLDDDHYTPAVVAKVKAKGARAWINSLGDTDKRIAAGDTTAFAERLKAGANIIQTDYPAKWKQFLQANGLYH